MRPGSVAGTVSMSPNCARSADIFGEMPNCETTVSRSMKQIRMWRAARGCAEPAVRLESSIEQPRKMMPENSPIQCRTPSECPTTVPAMWRDGRTPKAVGASTNERKMMPPIQTVRERNMRNRRMDIEAVLSSQFSVLSSHGTRRKEYWLLACFASLSGITSLEEERAVEEAEICAFYAETWDPSPGLRRKQGDWQPATEI